jgi:aspartyl-tRNA(Asn)/glutamyl-tRNA(Gln) amidotransferase subunit A
MRTEEPKRQIDPNMKTLLEIQSALQRGTLSSRALTEQALAAIDDPAGEGARAFLRVYRAAALAQADASDLLRKNGIVPSPIAGIPVSIKDLFDVAGDVTRAGSIILSDAPPAGADAPCIARLRAAGAIIVGRTNMTEFAYGAHGMNSHYGTPANAWDRAGKRIPGGSSSGAAVSLTDAMCWGAIGSDTGGSVRIPAALCGVTGFKPTQQRVPLEGAFPLSPTRDSIGPLANSVACCALLDAIMANAAPEVPQALPLKGLRFAVPATLLLDGLAPEVSKAFSAALKKIADAGALVTEIEFPELSEEIAVSARANISAVEAYAIHRQRLTSQSHLFDPRVMKRLMLGKDMLAADYFELIQARQRLMRSASQRAAHFDALLAPTVPIIAPTMAEMNISDEVFFRNNSLLLRNCAPFNFLNRPALSLPCHEKGGAPVGLMVVGESLQDGRVLAIGLSIEAALS